MDGKGSVLGDAETILQMDKIKPIERESMPLRRQVTARLREAILNGDLKPGQKLVERELCASLDVSRPLLREALPQLQAEGLITWVAHRGPSVAQVDSNEIREIFQIRIALESLAAREFARKATDEQIAQLRHEVSSQKPVTPSRSLQDVLSLKVGFYSVLFSGCGNKMIGQIVNQLINQVVLFDELALPAPDRLQEVIEELDAIVSAIEARDATLAGEMCAIHVRNADLQVRSRRFETTAVAL